VDRPGTVEITLSPGGRNGSKALKITSPFRADAGAGAVFTVKPHTRYLFSGWIRTENLENKGGKGAMLNIHGGNASEGVSGTKDWQEVSVEFDSANLSEVLLHCLFGAYGGATGTAFYDDLSLTEISGGNSDSAIESVAKYFAQKGDPAARQAVATTLATRPGTLAQSIVEALNAAPVVAKAVTKTNKPDAAIHERGLAVYSRTCIACHGPEGKGVAGAFPPLDGSSWATGDPTIPARILLHGLQGPIEVAGQKFENIMPPLTDLKDAEIADVLTYVRQSWANDAKPVSESQIKDARAKYMSRGKPWTAAELK
jgi:mono/diheme cytochrome c family protein